MRIRALVREWWLGLLVLLPLAGCVQTRADAILWEGKVFMCRSAEIKDTSWHLCRTDPAVTPDLLRQAEEISAREGVSLPVAIGRLTGWLN
jgi:hypothetical protein